MAIMHGMAMSVDIAILVEMAILVEIFFLVEMAIVVETVIMADFPLGAQNCEKILKTRVSRFLLFYPLISAFQTFSRISNDGL